MAKLNNSKIKLSSYNRYRYFKYSFWGVLVAIIVVAITRSTMIRASTDPERVGISNVSVQSEVYDPGRNILNSQTTVPNPMVSGKVTFDISDAHCDKLNGEIWVQDVNSGWFIGPAWGDGEFHQVAPGTYSYIWNGKAYSSYANRVRYYIRFWEDTSCGSTFEATNSDQYTSSFVYAGAAY